MVSYIFFFKQKTAFEMRISDLSSDLVSSDLDQIAQNVPALEVETAQLMEDLIGDLTAVPQPIEVKLFSADETALEDAAMQVGQALSQIQGVVEVVDGLRVAGSSVAVDRKSTRLNSSH